MSREITTQQTSLSGATLYASLDTDGRRWNGATFGPVTLSDWATYAVAMTEAAGTGSFVADLPAGITSAALLTVTLYRRAGGVPAATDPVVASGSIDWTGSVVATVSSRSTFAGGMVAGVGSPVTVGTVNDKAGYKLAGDGIDPVVIEAGLNARQALAEIAAFGAGALSGAATGSIVIKGAGVAATRITATTDSLGNRTAITLTPPA